MDLKQARILLKKINSLLNSLDLDGSKMSAIERDLMRSYIRELYEIFTEKEQQRQVQQRDSNSEERRSIQRSSQPKEESETPTDGPQLRKRLIPDPPTPKLRQDPPPPPPSSRPESREEPKAEPKEPNPPRSTPRPESPRVEAQPERARSSAKNNQDIQELFNHRQATELSEKLSEQPVSDLSKAMSINDRLLYMNELFERDMNALDESIKMLNNYDTMEQARPYLMNLAEAHNWAQEERKDIAESFIKLVRRRYQS